MGNFPWIMGKLWKLLRIMGIVGELQMIMGDFIMTAAKDY